MKESQGLKLSKQYCSSCHLYTPVELLDRTSWITVLKAMREEMTRNGINVPKSEWVEIYAHYVNSAGFALPVPPKEKPGILPVVIDTAFKSPRDIGDISLLECIDGNLLVIGELSGRISILDSSGYQFLGNTHPVPVDTEVNIDHLRIEVLSMGSMGPRYSLFGQVKRLNWDGEWSTIIDSLVRPIDMIYHDLDQDDNREILISVFGSPLDTIPTGGLFVQNDEIGPGDQALLSSPGVTKIRVVDMDSDGLDDILVLIAQGDERLVLLRNRGNMQFDAEVLLRFHPVFGSNDFDIRDMNGDGQPEILLVNGDNADYSQVFKPYHGLRVFEKDSEGEFQEVFFYHINGASKIHLTGLNNDPLTDIIVEAIYPDLFSYPYEQLTAFVNIEHLDFKPMILSEQPLNNMLRCAICDIDQNGEKELYIGGNNAVERNIPVVLRQQWAQESEMLYRLLLHQNM